MALERYHAKRDFRLTPEPKGKIPKGRVGTKTTKRLRFVIQRHAATRLHYDFRLELDGVLKSWAVTKVPSPVLGTKRLAVEVEDHPLDYREFEGTIPKGQYGAGTVQLWDLGHWAPIGDPHEGLAKGNFKFVVSGERLQGGWALIRLKNDKVRFGKKPQHNWLLIKERDAFAREGDPDMLLAEETSVKSGRTLEEIAANRRGRIWQSKAKKKRSTVLDDDDPPPAKPVKPSANRGAKKTAMPGFVEPQLARLVDAPPNGPAWIHEAKLDGYRMQLRVLGGKANLRTRTGLDWSARFPEIVKEGKSLPDCILDGEVCALAKDGIPDFGALQDRLNSGDTNDLLYYVFDILFLNGFDVRGQNLLARKDLLKTLIAHAGAIPHFNYVEHFEVSGPTMYALAKRMNLEGIISKRRDAPYRSGRGDAWCKTKCRGGQEVVIGGWWGDANTLRSLQVGTFDDGGFLYRGSVGTGFNTGNVPALLKILRPLRRKTTPFDRGTTPPANKSISWAEPILVAEIAHAGISSDGLFRQASFKALRQDKPAANVKAETAAAAGEEPPRSIFARLARDPLVAGVTITHPEKILWPATDTMAAVSKLDLARYYEKAAHRILPHIQFRPLSLVRAPDGIERERFYQRHAMVGIPGIAIPVSGESRPYHGVGGVKDLVALAQAGVVEFHPWGCKENHPDTPERLIFDLDPDEALAFVQVIEGARIVAAMLKTIGFTPFIKTTGGKGLHVVAAIKGTPKQPVTWVAAKAFARSLCERLAVAYPDRFTATPAKKRRSGKIFLDYLRNDRSATAAGPYSPRARDGATVAVPVPWSKLKNLEPKAFTIAGADRFLKGPDPWKDLAASAIPLGRAREKPVF